MPYLLLVIGCFLVFFLHLYFPIEVINIDNKFKININYTNPTNYEIFTKHFLDVFLVAL